MPNEKHELVEFIAAFVQKIILDFCRKAIAQEKGTDAIVNSLFDRIEKPNTKNYFTFH